MAGGRGRAPCPAPVSSSQGRRRPLGSTQSLTSQGGAARALRVRRTVRNSSANNPQHGLSLGVALSHQVTSILDQVRGTGRPQAPAVLGSAQSNGTGSLRASRLPRAAPQVCPLLCLEAGEEPTRWRPQPLWDRGQSAALTLLHLLPVPSHRAAPA